MTLKPLGDMNGAPDADATREAPAAPPWMAHYELLQARIETLEQQVEALSVTPRSHSSLIPERLHDFNPAAREHRLPGAPTASHNGSSPADGEERRTVFRTEMRSAATAPSELFVRNFQPSTLEIGLLVPAGDAAARRVAETLTGVVIRAGWKVRSVIEDMTLAQGRCGLIFAAAPTLPIQRVTSTLNALREAGFAVTFQLDPERGTSEAMLVVGAGAGSENEADLKS